MSSQHKCGIAGCKRLVAQRACLCAPCRELLPADLLKQIDTAYEGRLKGDTSALNTYYHALAQASLVVRRKEAAKGDLFGEIVIQ